MFGRRHVLPPGVLDTLAEVQVEGTFSDGTHLVTVHDSICSDDGDLESALYGSFLPLSNNDVFKLEDGKEDKHGPGAYLIRPGMIVLNEGRDRIGVRVTNNGDRPVQVRMKFLVPSHKSAIVFMVGE